MIHGKIEFDELIINAKIEVDKDLQKKKFETLINKLEFQLEEIPDDRDDLISRLLEAWYFFPVDNFDRKKQIFLISNEMLQSSNERNKYNGMLISGYFFYDEEEYVKAKFFLSKLIEHKSYISEQQWQKLKLTELMIVCCIKTLDFDLAKFHISKFVILYDKLDEIDRIHPKDFINSFNEIGKVKHSVDDFILNIPELVSRLIEAR